MYNNIVESSSEVPDHCFDIATGGSSPIRFWGIRGRNVVCKYGRYGSSTPYVLASLVSANVDKYSMAIGGDSEGKCYTIIIVLFHIILFYFLIISYFVVSYNTISIIL